VVGVVFGLRAVAVAVGLLVVVQRGMSAVAFVAGFFGVYFALQWIEVSYVTAASKDAGEYAWIASIASITASSVRSAPAAISLIVGDRPRSCHSVSNVR